MDERIIRAQLETYRQDLAKIETEREALLTVIKGLEGLLRVRGNLTVNPAQLPLKPTNGRNKPRGEVSLRAAVLEALREARGQALHCRDIMARAHALGAKTEAKNPQSIVDLTAHSLKKAGAPIEKMAPRTWRWMGEE